MDDGEVIGSIEVADVTYELIEVAEGGEEVVVVRSASGALTRCGTLADALDTVLCDDESFRAFGVPQQSLLEWATYNAYRLPDPLFFEADDVALAAIRHEGITGLVPSCLEGLDPHNDLDEFLRSGEVETVWEFSVSWDTGAVTSFGYSEDLYRFQNVYYLFQWKESGKEITRVGYFPSESDGRLAASRFSEVPYYRELAERFPDED